MIADPRNGGSPASAHSGIRPTGTGDALALVIWGLLGTHALARVLASATPSMALWGLNLGRFLDPTIAWFFWTCLVLTLFPQAAETVAHRLDTLGNSLIDSHWAPLAMGAAAAFITFLFADHTYFVGDFLQRVEAARPFGPGVTSGTFEAAMPLDLLLHAILAGLLDAPFGAGGFIGPRVVGALEAGVLAMLATSFAKRLGYRGRITCMVVCVVFFAGYLTMFTGLGKPASELCLLMVAAANAAVNAVRTGRGLGTLGIVLTLGLLTHRSAVLLVPVWICAWLMAWPTVSERRAAGSVWGLGLVLPLSVAALMSRRIVALNTTFDVKYHLMPADVAQEGGLFVAVFAPDHLANIGNLLVAMSPAIAFLAPLLVMRGRALLGTLEGRVLVVQALSALLVWALVHPQQGIFRDWDVFAPAAVPLCLLAAYALAEVLTSAPAHRWLVVPLSTAVMASSLGWLVHFHDPSRALPRIHAFANESRSGTPLARMRTWQFLTNRYTTLEQWPQAVDASAHTGEPAAHRRVLLSWAVAETRAGDNRAAETIYLRLLETDPKDPLAWLGLGGVAIRLGDTLQIRKALATLANYPTHGLEARRIRRHLRYFPEVWPRADTLLRFPFN